MTEDFAGDSDTSLMLFIRKTIRVKKGLANRLRQCTFVIYDALCSSSNYCTINHEKSWQSAFEPLHNVTNDQTVFAALALASLRNCL